MQYHEKIIQAFLTHVKVADIARETGLAEKTIRKYRADPELQKILHERQDEMVSAALATMRGYLNDSVKELIEIIRDKNTPVQTRVNAIQLLLKQCADWTNTEDIQKRLEALEGATIPENTGLEG